MIEIGFVIDELDSLKVEKDSTLALIEAARAKGWQTWVMTQPQLTVINGEAFAKMMLIELQLGESPWYQVHETSFKPLSNLAVIMMRKDPPVNMAYFYATYILELAERAGVLVLNKPQALRDANEKLLITQFPDCIADTMVTARVENIRQFFEKHQDIIIKPLDAMGGESIYRLQAFDQSAQEIIATMTNNQQQPIMLQRFLPDIFTKGDKRIFLIDGKPVAYAVQRMPAKGEVRANLAAGGSAQVIELSERDYWLCQQISEKLRKKGLFFVGLDVIGDYITEINVTCPTCIRELYAATGIDVAAMIIEAIPAKVR